jgi:hypothetical protein
LFLSGIKGNDLKILANMGEGKLEYEYDGLDEKRTLKKSLK